MNDVVLHTNILTFCMSGEPFHVLKANVGGLPSGLFLRRW
jgi:hypothetical protein